MVDLWASHLAELFGASIILTTTAGWYFLGWVTEAFYRRFYTFIVSPSGVSGNAHFLAKLVLDVGFGFCLKYLNIEVHETISHPVMNLLLGLHLLCLCFLGMLLCRGYLHCYLAVCSTLWLAIGFVISEEWTVLLIVLFLIMGGGLILVCVLLWMDDRYANTNFKMLLKFHQRQP